MFFVLWYMKTLYKTIISIHAVVAAYFLKEKVSASLGFPATWELSVVCVETFHLE